MLPSCGVRANANQKVKIGREGGGEGALPVPHLPKRDRGEPASWVKMPRLEDATLDEALLPGREGGGRLGAAGGQLSLVVSSHLELGRLLAPLR